jgi:mRNA-degrading endonuclease RelE of RelBE toxin-antitoxin system
MENKAILSSVATKEIQDSYQWYEDRLEGLGSRFVGIIDKTIEFILLSPDGYPEKSPPYREIVLKNFPYVLVYEFDKTKHIIYILHIFHTKRNPRLKYKLK